MRLFKYTPKKEFLKIARIAIAAMRNYKKNFTTLFETKLLNKKGEEVPVEISGKAVLNEKGRPIGVQGNVRDISERLLTEQALSVSEAQNSAILEAIPDLMFLISREGEFLSYKAASKDLYTDPSQFINKNIFDVLPTQLAERTMKYVQNSLEEGKIQIFEYQLPVDGKQFDWEARMVKMNNDTVLTVIRDITDNKNLEQQLRQVQKMESIGTLVGGIAHDFNNLLTAINGYAELFLMNCEKDHPSYDDIGSILNAGRKAENLTRQLLAFSRKQITEPKIIDINILISDLDKMMRRLVNEDIDMEMNFFKNISFIKADPTQIEQILINLIVNARDAINQCTSLASEKKITVETDQVYLDEAYVAKHVESKTGLHVIISVSDNGIGIDEEIKNKIFEPFFTTKKIGHGTGLGLATVYGIVKQNKGSIYVIIGSIYVYTETAQGRTIKIYWPATDEKKISDFKEKISEEKLVGNETVLFVEDDKGVRDFACAVLKELGYHVFEASNGKKALELIREKDLKPDLLITDLIMPEMNGKELAESLEILYQDILILYASGYTDNHIVHSGILDEGINFIQKPYSVQTLSKKVREILNSKIV